MAGDVVRLNFDPVHGTRVCVRLVTGDAVLQVSGVFDMTGVSAGEVNLALPLDVKPKQFLSDRKAAAVGIEVTYSGACPPQWQQADPPLFAVASVSNDEGTGPAEFVFQAIDTTPSITFDASGVIGTCAPSNNTGKVAFDSVCTANLPAGNPVSGTIKFTDIFGGNGDPLPFRVVGK
ncbi:hypothetical protein [Sinorhizobium meliloti]|uniref:hypothetical protein n=1 Tax=Rhizobium meliloti TaxID=382 RepID=UPI000FDA5162|nr:hypothetical protein [Sinorhizobium meliloti]RVM04158.1 hypothetical protein CN134_32125 [Sinorhizobium meliloti]RVO21845.1 hypothetical protein CN098_32595 [Sinorhizobium meliloti]